ncbi:MAG TPA: hypothetical protein VFR19_14775 [Hyphomicrobiaceae bacterium]|jgi:hypothetical protein|nr:hypothetical protein [Hyphomicrobiaceae bacterium]
MFRIGAIGAVVLALAAVSGSTHLRALEATAGDWTRYHNERFGFRLEYPANLFRIERTTEAGDGRVFVAREGEARLLVGALRNEDHHSAKSYQDYLARNSYADYKITYRPLGDDWLVLSGEADGRIFYEKAILSCGGQLISSFAMLYPADKRDLFDPIVARVANSFVPGTKPCHGAPSSASARHGAEAKAGPPKGAGALGKSEQHWRGYSSVADRIARERGTDVILILRRTTPPYDYKYVRGYASR